MPDTLRDQLRTALGSAYTLARELGGGGMSRVFVAREEALGRDVVVKVLAPELAEGLSAERFAREIRLAARLQHPHVVPLLSAGAVDGLPYYTMPFVAGESLRERLRRDGALPVADVVRLLRELADALGYAHRDGVVHRDLKPENVLLSQGHALVADFGVAKALAGATVGGAGGLTAGGTGLGVAVGTPAYMAPEQAAADPATDHRADLYALGVIAYEALVGAHPFAGCAPQALLAAHLTETPPPVGERRAGVPAALGALVARLLAKRPADRPADAGAVLAALDGIETGETPARRRAVASRTAVAVGLAATLAAAAAGWAWWTRAREGPRLDDALVVVAPFRVAGADPTLGYLREGMLDLLAAKLTGEGGPRAGDPRTLLAAWQRRAGSAGADLPEAEAVALAGELGAGQLLLGSVVGTPRRVSLRAALHDVPSGDVRTTADVEGPADSLGALVDRLAASLLARSAGEGERLAGTVATAPLPVLRLYLAGAAAVRRGRYPEAQQHFLRALALDSTFVPAAFGLATNNGNHPIDDSRAWAILDREGARLTERDRAQLEVRRRFLRGDSYASQLEASRRLVALAPDRAEGWADMGDQLALFGRMTGAEDFRQRARGALTRALALDPEFTPPLRALLVVSAELGDTAAVRSLWPRYERVAAGALEFETARWTVAHALGDTAALAALRARFDALPPRDLLRIAERMMVNGRGLEDAPAVLRALEASAVDEYDVARGGLAMWSYRRNGGRDDAVPARFARTYEHPALEDVERVVLALVWDGDTTAARAAAARLDAIARGGSPLVPEPFRRGVACVPALWHLARGDTAAALPSLAVARRPRAASGERGEPGVNACVLSAEALLAEARGTPGRDALGRLDSLLAEGYEQTQPAALIAARLHERRGDLRAALAAVRRRSNHGRDGPIALTTMLREEGRLAARIGDATAAIRAYRHFLALRPDPAPRLRADRDRVRAALARLEAGAR